jgi:RNA polymerase sigma-70 factor (ECF subfamily)
MAVAAGQIEERMSEALQPLPAQPAAAEGDWQDKFVNENLRRFFLQIYRMVGDTADAQDLTQEVFIKALQRSGQQKQSGKAAHWLSRIATNTAIDFLRRHGRINCTALEELPEPVMTSREEDAESLLLRREQSGFLERGLAQLSERERTALLLRDVEDLPADEVARQMNCSKATVRSHIANARLKFRRFLERVPS